MSEPLVVNDRVTIPADEIEITFARSGGPGGQHVNTTDTRVRLRFALSRNTSIPDDAKARLRDRARSWLTDDGDLLLTSDTTRSRLQNLDEAYERLASAVRAALVRPKTRHATKPSRGSQLRRLDAKKGRKDVKAGRGRVRDD